MSKMMQFPEKWEDFVGQYCFTDTEKVYTNGIELIPVFRIIQMMKHYFENTIELNKEYSSKDFVISTENQADGESQTFCIKRRK